jgi:AcrR family transcriptional regulator
MTPSSLSGRRAEAARNDELVLEAARKVLISTPDAPMSQIADRAGVGIGTLYRRYPSKEALVSRLCLDAMRQLEGIARAAAERAEAEPWDAFEDFMRASLAAGAGGLGPSLAGTFAPPEELMQVSRAMAEAVRELVTAAQRAGVVRDDVAPEEMGLLFEILRAVSLGGEERTAGLQQRYLTLMLQALRAPASGPLPAAPPTWQEISRRWSA